MLAATWFVATIALGVRDSQLKKEGKNPSKFCAGGTRGREGGREGGRRTRMERERGEAGPFPVI